MGTMTQRRRPMPIYFWIILKKIYPFLQGLSMIYLRFLDDIFFIWTGSKKQLIRNLDELSTKYDSIKF